MSDSEFDESLRLYDNILFIVCFCFMLFAGVMVHGVIENVKRNTSEPDKCKKIKREHRTWSELVVTIFGEKRHLYDYLLPTKPVYSKVD